MRRWILPLCLCALTIAAVADDAVERRDLWRETRRDALAPAPATPSRAPGTWSPLADPVPAVQALADAVAWADVLADIEWLVGLGNRYSLNANIHTVADSLEARLADLGLTTEQFDFDLGGTTVPNVIATQTGSTYPDSIFVLCAHFDAVSEDVKLGTPGADDNASGTIAVLTAARLLAPRQLNCTVQYVLFGGEEQGLRGARAWTADLVARGVDLAGALNFDMIGWWEAGVPFDLEIETNLHSRWIAEAVADCATTYAAMPYVLHEAEDITWGDFYAFWEQGYAAVNHEESWDWGNPDFNPHYHTTQDLVQYLDPDFTTGNVRVAVTAVATLAGLAGGPSATRIEAPVAALSAHPDPFNGRTHLVLEAPGCDGVAVAELFDLRGRRLRSLPLQVNGGRAETTLEAVDRYGRALATGVYLVRVDLPSGPLTRRLTYVR